MNTRYYVLVGVIIRIAHIIWAILPHAQLKNNLALITEFLLEEKSLLIFNTM